MVVMVVRSALDLACLVLWKMYFGEFELLVEMLPVEHFSWQMYCEIHLPGKYLR